MQRPISPRTHGLLDYATVATAAAAPKLLDFPAPAAAAAYTLAGGYLLLSALTDYPPAVKRAVPLQAHGAADAALGLVLPALPWALGFAEHRGARNFFLALTGVTLTVTALTNWSGRRRG